MAARRPKVAPLWLGAALSGMLNEIPNLLKSMDYMPNTCPEATIWTDSSQGFLDLAFYGMPPSSTGDKGDHVILREDEFRLLYLTDVMSKRYGPPPLSPYAPFGVVNLNRTPREVRLHAFCGHRLDYSHWVWRGWNRQRRVDFYLAYPQTPGQLTSFTSHSVAQICRLLSWLPISVSTLLDPISSLWHFDRDFLHNERLCEVATRNIFSWILFAEGLDALAIRRGQMVMWKHEWLRCLIDRLADDRGVPVSSKQREYDSDNGDWSAVSSDGSGSKDEDLDDGDVSFFSDESDRDSDEGYVAVCSAELD
jgi:hypothetical protein